MPPTAAADAAVATAAAAAASRGSGGGISSVAGGGVVSGFVGFVKYLHGRTSQFIAETMSKRQREDVDVQAGWDEDPSSDEDSAIARTGQ
jgi:hypothetical protein